MIQGGNEEEKILPIYAPLCFSHHYTPVTFVKLFFALLTKLSIMIYCIICLYRIWATFHKNCPICPTFSPLHWLLSSPTALLFPRTCLAITWILWIVRKKKKRKIFSIIFQFTSNKARLMWYRYYFIQLYTTSSIL